MIPYVGDLSRNDAALLRRLAEQADRILEFGAGASTQILAAYGRGCVHSVETDPAWVTKTARHLNALGLTDRVCFHSYPGSPASGAFDLIFVDGIDSLRREFAFAVWPRLAVGGVLAWHDTRRTQPHGGAAFSDIQNVCAVVAAFSTEIDRLILNQDDSNISVVTRRAPLRYEDWNVTEGRTLAQIGLA